MTQQRCERCLCGFKPAVEPLERRSLLSTAYAMLYTGETRAFERSADQSLAGVHRLDADAGRTDTAMSDQSSAARFVTRVYETYLGRAPEVHGLAYWVGELRSGLSTEAVRRSIMDSPEHFQMLSGSSTVGGGDAQGRPAAARGYSARAGISGSVGSASGTSAIGSGLSNPGTGTTGTGTGASGAGNLGTGTTLNGVGTSGSGFGMFPAPATGVAGIGTIGSGLGTGLTPGIGTAGGTTNATGFGTNPGQSLGTVGTGIGTSGVNPGTNLTGTGAAGTGTTSTGTTTGTGTNTTGA